jgi:hypothetical protein
MVKKTRRRRKFSNNQLVVIRFGDRKIVGKVVFMRPIGKQFIYDVECEDGKIYYELLVDATINNCIDTYLTKLFYQKYKIDENALPEVEGSDLILNTTKVVEMSVNDLDSEEEESEYVFDEEDAAMFADEDSNPDY